MDIKSRQANALRLNPLQLKTLTILQALAALPDYAAPADEEGRVRLTRLPQPHGDHFHVGASVVRSRDATGLFNPAVYGALARKGLVASELDQGPVLTAAGMSYETGLADGIFHRVDH